MVKVIRYGPRNLHNLLYERMFKSHAKMCCGRESRVI